MKTVDEFLEELKKFFEKNDEIIRVFNNYQHGRIDLCKEALFMIRNFQEKVTPKEYKYYVVYSYRMNNFTLNGATEIRQTTSITCLDDIIKIGKDLEILLNVSNLVVLSWREY